MDSIANDYENFETIISEVRRFAADSNAIVSPEEVREVLKALVDEGYARAYVLSCEPSASPQPVSISSRRMEDLWFYLTPKGLEAVSG